MTAPKQALIAFLCFGLLTGVIEEYLSLVGIPGQGWWSVTSALVGSTIIFIWYYFDSELIQYKRSKWLSICMIGLAFLAVPYYLIRSRPRGQKLQAFACGIGVLLAYAVLIFIGKLSVAVIA